MNPYISKSMYVRKAKLRGRFTALNACVRVEATFQIKMNLIAFTIGILIVEQIIQIK
jgi:hypothetical protein